MRTLRGLAVGVALLLAVGCGDPVRGPAGTPAAASSDPGPALQAMLDTERDRYGAPGAVAVLHVGDRRWAVTSGTADNHHTPLEATDTFRIASITKPVLATLVLTAVDRGELSLDDTVGNLLPGVLRDKPAVTVRMLLDHTSGIFDELNEGDPRADIAKLNDPALAREAGQLLSRYSAGEHVIASDRLLVALAETHDRYFPPGAAFHYSNTNYQLAAMVLEKVTGQSLASLLRTRIVETLRLRHTTIAPPDLRSPVMRGYAPTPTTNVTDVTDDLIMFGNGGNGGIISNAEELLAILRATLAGRFFSPTLVTDMITPTVGTYGLGLGAYPTECGVFFGHGGAVNGTGSIAMVSANGRNGVVIAQNLLDDHDADLAALAEQMMCTVVA